MTVPINSPAPLFLRQQVWQLRDIARDAPRFVLGQRVHNLPIVSIDVG
jgi:hypothetical protein